MLLTRIRYVPLEFTTSTAVFRVRHSPLIPKLTPKLEISTPTAMRWLSRVQRLIVGKRDVSTDICYFAFDKHANKIEECWVRAPYTGMLSLGYPLTLGMIHECAVSKNWIIFILLPLCVSLDRLKGGGKHFMWDNNLPMTLGLLPRNNPRPEDMRWYPIVVPPRSVADRSVPESFIGHIGNAFDCDEHNVCLDTPLENGNVFGAFFPTDKNERPAPGVVTSASSDSISTLVNLRGPSSVNQNFLSTSMAECQEWTTVSLAKKNDIIVSA